MVLAPAWSLWLALGFGMGSFLALSLAITVYAARPRRLQNRALAILLFLEALSSAAAALHLATQDVDASRAGLFTFFAFWILTLTAYPVFLGTLRTPFARPLRRSAILAAIWIACGVWIIWMFLDRSAFLVGPLYVDGTPEFAYGPAAQSFVLVSLPLPLYALMVAVSAWRRADPGSPHRTQAKAYANAFLVRDTLLIVSVINFLLLPWLVSANLFGSVEALVIGRTVYIAQIVSFPILAGYGILKHQLFDIDLRIRWALKRGTVLTALTLVFFTVKEAIEALLPLEGVLPSLSAAAVIGLLGIPVWRAAEHIVNRLMPHVEDTADYRSARRLDVYRAALVEALVDGELSSKDRKLLSILADQLDLPSSEARRIERALTPQEGVIP